jgi:hypothetical protein
VDRILPSIIVGAILLLALAGMYLGWLSRRRRQADLPALGAAPADPGRVLAEAEGLYVATTLAGAPLERIAVRGLGFRSRASVTVAESGVVLALTGQEPAFLPRASLRGIGRATWTIDKAVETGGLVALGWRLGDRDVESYLRLDGDPSALLTAVEGIAVAAIEGESA